MRSIVKFVGLVSLTAVLAACASSPPQATPAAASRVQTPASAATPATPASSSAATPAAAAPAATTTSTINASLLGRGYRPEQYKGGTVYCRSEAVTGTTFKRKICMTESQIKAQDKNTQDTQDAMNKQRTNPGCFTKTCG